MFRKRGRLRPEEEADIEELLDGLAEIRETEVSEELKPKEVIDNPFLKLMEGSNEAANDNGFRHESGEDE